MTDLGRTLVVLGVALAACGLYLSCADKLGLPRLGRLPGDIVYRTGWGKFYFPLTTCLLLSALLTLALAFASRR